MADTDQTNFTTLTVDLLSAYFANNTVDSDALPGLIRSTHDALKQIDTGTPETPAAPEYTPAVSVRRSTASKDFIISLIDGKKYQTLKRHLTRHGLTPAAYRERYGLPHDYPMVAPSFSEARRQVAAKIGLGRKATPTTEPAPIEAAAPAEAPAPAGKVSQPKKSAAVKSTTKAAVKKAAPAKSKAATPTAEPAAPLSETASVAAAPAAADAPNPTKAAPKKASPKARAATKAAPTKTAPAEAPADEPKPAKATRAKAPPTTKPAAKVPAKRTPRAAKAPAPAADTAES